MLKTQLEPRAALQSFEYFMAPFLWSIRVQTMKNCGRFVFYNNILIPCDVFIVVFRIFCSTFAALSTNSLSEISLMLKFGSFLPMLSKIIFTKTKNKQPTLSDMLRHFHGLYSLDHSSQPISVLGFAQLL